MSTAQACFPINRIILRSAKVQMVWIHTRRIIASMTNLKGVIQLSSMNKHRYSMSANVSLEFIMPELSIPLRVKTALPNPALIWVSNRDLFPKSILNRSRFWTRGARDKRVSIDSHTHPMHTAKPLSIVRLGTFLNGTFFHKRIIAQPIGDIA